MCYPIRAAEVARLSSYSLFVALPSPRIPNGHYEIQPLSFCTAAYSGV